MHGNHNCGDGLGCGAQRLWRARRGSGGMALTMRSWSCNMPVLPCSKGSRGRNNCPLDRWG
eukprot:12945129-Alexandrium_andersonii.AAC.1